MDYDKKIADLKYDKWAAMENKKIDEKEMKRLKKFITKTPIALKRDFLARSNVMRLEALKAASKKEIDDWTTAGVVATGLLFRRDRKDREMLEDKFNR